MEDKSVSAIYRSVIDTVIERVKPDFVQEGVDESVLDELRLNWEKKLKESGALEPEPAPAPPRYQQKLQQQPTRQMPPLPAFLSNLTAQQPAAAHSYAAAGSPAQYLQSRQPQAAVTTPQLPVITGVPLGAPPVSVPLPSDRLHPHLLSHTVPRPQQQLQRTYYSNPVNTYTAPLQQQAQHGGASSSGAAPQPTQYQQRPQVPQQGYQQQGHAQGTAQQQQQLPRQQQPHSQQHLNGAHQGRQQPSLQSLLSLPSQHAQAGYGAPALETRKRKAEDDHSALFSLLPDSKPSAGAPAAPSIPQQDGPGDDTDDKDEVTDDEKAEKEKERGETFSDVSSEPEEEDDQQIANIVVGQFEKVARTRQKWKVHLKDGVMRINGKDHLFHTAVGDMLF